MPPVFALEAIEERRAPRSRRDRRRGRSRGARPDGEPPLFVSSPETHRVVGGPARRAGGRAASRGRRDSGARGPDVSPAARIGEDDRVVRAAIRASVELETRARATPGSARARASAARRRREDRRDGRPPSPAATGRGPPGRSGARCRAAGRRAAKRLEGRHDGKASGDAKGDALAEPGGRATGGRAPSRRGGSAGRSESRLQLDPLPHDRPRHDRRDGRADELPAGERRVAPLRLEALRIDLPARLRIEEGDVGGRPAASVPPGRPKAAAGRPRRAPTNRSSGSDAARDERGRSTTAARSRGR